MRNKLSLILVFISLCLLFSGISTYGQSSLFSIPTTDVQEKGSTYLEIDFDTHLTRNHLDRWQSFGVMTVRGIGRRTEIGLNVYALRIFEGFEPLELQPNIKFDIYSSEINGLALSAGAVGYLPLKRNFHKDSSVSVYAVTSKTFKSKWTPRLTGGGYQLIGRNPDKSETRGFLVGVEQPLSKRLNFIVDWNTAKNRLGYSAAGFGWNINKRSSLYSAYYFGNTGRGNNSLGVYYGLNL